MLQGASHSSGSTPTGPARRPGRELESTLAAIIRRRLERIGAGSARDRAVLAAEAATAAAGHLRGRTDAELAALLGSARTARRRRALVRDVLEADRA